MSGPNPLSAAAGCAPQNELLTIGQAGQYLGTGERFIRRLDTALLEMEAGIGGTSRAVSASTDRRGTAVPGIVAIEDRAEFLAGWAAGQAAASACGPLPDEIARDVVLLLDTTTPAPVSPRRPRGGVRDAG